MRSLFPALRRITLLYLPFAAVFTVGLTLPKSVSAQYPGGGYPGNGLAPGWKPLPNPNAGTPHYPIYDWIGFDDQITRTPFNSAPQPQTVHSYGGGAEGNVGGGNYMMEYPFNGTGGPGNTLAEANAKITGTAQYKWQWVPPTIAGQPDWIDFPAPTLFTLADVYAMAWTRTSNNAGLAATGALSDGLPDKWSATLTGVPQQIGDIVPRRAALPTVVEPPPFNFGRRTGTTITISRIPRRGYTQSSRPNGKALTGIPIVQRMIFTSCMMLLPPARPMCFP